MPVAPHRISLYRLIGVGLIWMTSSGLSPGVELAAGAEPADERDWPRTDFSKRTIDLDEIQSGGPPKDGIPAIDRPVFVTVERASRWLDPAEPVIVLVRGELVRAYPLQILIWHEIVNDDLVGLPVAVTFCPLCNASVVFDRRVDGRLLDFGTTGKLRRSDLIMYDRQTESWWQQFTGMGIVGEYAGVALRRVAAQIVSFQALREAHSDAEVLSRETGYRRSYGRNPYRGYDRIGDQPFLLKNPADPRLPAMERVVSVTVGQQHRIYPFSGLKETGVLNDRLAEVPVVIFHRRNLRSVLDRPRIRDSRMIQAATAYERRLGDRLLDFDVVDGAIRDLQTGSEWDLLGRARSGPLRGRQLRPVDSGVHFAFAWLAFNPDTDIYGQ